MTSRQTKTAAELMESAGVQKGNQLRQEVLKKFQNMKDLTPEERRELLEKLSPRGVRPKPPTIKYVEGANIKNLPPKLKAIFERAKTDTEMMNAILNELNKGFARLSQHAQSHQSFCDLFIFPAEIGKKIISIIGISEGELKEEVAKIGFNQIHRNYSNLYYITLALVYSMALYADQQPSSKSIRILSIMFISARYWDSMSKNVFSTGCDHEYAKYATQYLTKNNSDFKKYGTPIAYFTQFFIISVDNLLPAYIRQDVANPKTGMIKILTAIQPRIQQFFAGTFRKHYYYAYNNGLKVTSSDAYASAYANKNEMIESKETIQNTIDKILDKFKKNQMMAKNILFKPEAKNYLKHRFNVSDKVIKIINDYIDDNSEDMEMIAEFLLQGIEPKTEDEVCALNVEGTTTRIGNSKKNENFIKFKEYRNQITKHLFGEYNLNEQSRRNLENIVGRSLFIYVKLLICKSL